MKEFINSILLDFALANQTENSFQKFSDLLKSLSDNRLNEYIELIKNCWEENDDEKALDSIKKASFLYTRFISIFEKPETFTFELKDNVEWIQNLQLLLVLENLRREGVFADVQGSLIGEEFLLKPGEDCEDSKNFVLASKTNF